jgi:hypothetical protein
MNPPNDCVVESMRLLVGSLKKNTTLEYSTRVVQEGDRRCEKSTLNGLAYLTPLRIPLINPVYESVVEAVRACRDRDSVGDAKKLVQSLNHSTIFNRQNL